jgi:hypothetical protein
VNDQPRTYRFSPLDRTGLLLGLSGVQCALVAAGIFTSGLLLDAGAPVLVVLAPTVALLVATFARWNARPIYEWAPVLARFGFGRLSGRDRWTASIPLLTGTPLDGRREPALPPFLRGLAIVDAGPVSWSPATRHVGVGVVRDRQRGTVTGTVPVQGRAFSLLERGDQERLLHTWGDVIAGFCNERGRVSRVQVTERTAPAGLGEHERFLVPHESTARNGAALESYRELLTEAGSLSVAHEVLVTITVDPRRISNGRGRGVGQHDGVVDALLEELRLVSMRLEAASLVVGSPLSPTQIAEALRLRLDPGCGPALETRRASLAELAGLVHSYSSAPLATRLNWDHVRTDGSLHRTYWVSEWPRLEVGPNWLEPLLLHGAGVRTFSLHYEPVPPSGAQRRIDRDSTRLAADEEQRERAGFRVGARHRRAQTDVLEREAELVAGYAELEYAGFVTVTAPDPDALALACASYEQAAAQAGLELRALDGRHDLGVVCALPLGRGLAERGIA